MNTLEILAKKFNFWKYFFELSKIPRPSRHEEQVCKWIIELAKKWRLAYKQDSFGNISVRVPANKKELEKLPLIALQGHLDMVCEKDSDILHDFFKDPLKLKIIEETFVSAIGAGSDTTVGSVSSAGSGRGATQITQEWITATGTTLGADNGIAVAYQIALMDPECQLAHGQLEMIFTLDEETGLNGAAALADDMVHAKYMINIDNSSEGMCCIGCAGGKDYIAEVPLLRESLALAISKGTHSASKKFTEGDANAKQSAGDATSNFTHYQLVIDGLAGGHSGMEIYDGRASAIKLAERVLSDIIDAHKDVYVSAINGGDKRNAIPRSTSIDIYVKNTTAQAIITQLKELELIIRKELLEIDKSVTLKLKEVKIHSLINKASMNNKSQAIPHLVLTHASLQNIIKLIRLTPHGVFYNRTIFASGPTLSSNLASIHTTDTHMRFVNNSRFANSVGGAHITRVLDSVYKEVASKIYSENGYVAWEAIENSALEQLFKKYYKIHNNIEVKIDIVHGGIECGIIKAKQKYTLDVISIGPEIKFLHSPQEKINVLSTENMWHVLGLMLLNAKELQK